MCLVADYLVTGEGWGCCRETEALASERGPQASAHTQCGLLSWSLEAPGDSEGQGGLV